MYDSLIFQYSGSVDHDSVQLMDSIQSDTILAQEVLSFIQLEKVNVEPVVHSVSPEYDYITYILFALIGVIAVIWHFMPDRFSMIFSLKTEKNFQRIGDTGIKVPGTMITGFFWFNFIIVTGLFILILLQSFFSDHLNNLPFIQLLGYIYLFFGSLLLYRVIVIYGTALIFDTRKMMQQQVVTGRNVQFVTGVFLAPIIILMIYSKNEYLLYISLGFIALLQLIRISKIMIIGKSSTMFSVLHIILYLCTLEIVPILVLIRLIGNVSGV